MKEISQKFLYPHTKNNLDAKPGIRSQYKFFGVGVYSLWGAVFLFSGLLGLPQLTLADASSTALLAPAANIADAVPDNELIVSSLTPAKNGATAEAFAGGLALTFGSSTLLEASDLELIKLNEPVALPWQLNLASPVYQFDLKNKSALATKKSIKLKIKPIATGNFFRQIFFYDKTSASWKPLPSKEQKGMVSADIFLTYARVAVFEYPEILTTGRASWYKYKNGLFTASPDFPKGSRLRVINSANNKFVDVVVNDFGPDRTKHPDRSVDLDKVAYKKIAALGTGIIKVRVEPLYIASINGASLGISKSGAGTEPRLASKSGIVINSKTGELLWGKAATTTMPLASLTKLVTAKVFLDTRPSLGRIAAYSKQDEEYNYRYAEAWSVARLKVKDGETMSIEDFFYAALVGSANNTIESLVRLSGLTRDEFIARMNQQAADWGASSTHFVEPTGLSPENVSTVADYAIIAGKALDHPIIEKASKMKSYEFYTRNTKKRHLIKNTNPLVSLINLTVTGSKTGYLDEAGYCLMTRAKNSRNREVIAVTFGSPSRAVSFSETEQLLRYGLRQLK